MSHVHLALALSIAGFLGCDSQAPVPVDLVRDVEYRSWSAEAAARQVVDFRYSPRTWDTSICLPDDPQKTLVSEKGELLIDYPGKFTRFRTRIGLLPEDGMECLSQELEDSRVPIVTSSWGTPGGAAPLSTIAFTVAPDAPLPVAAELPLSLSLVRAVGPQRAEPGWGKPASGAPAVFHDIVVGWDDTIAYRLPASEGDGVIALAFIESWHREAGARIMEVRIEGEVRGTVDPIADFGLNRPGVRVFEAADGDGDGELLVEVLCTEESADGNATLAGLWAFDEPVDAETLVDGTCSVTTTAFLDCGGGRRYSGPPRADVLRFLDGADGTTRIVVDSEDRLELAEDRQHVLVDGVAFLAFTAPWTAAEHEGERWIFSFERELEEVAAVVASGFAIGEVTVDWVHDREEEIRRFWRELDLPYEVIQVPDPGIQRLLETSIRNIWQAREMKDGLPSFNVGPTCYRGLWIVDGAFLLEAVTYLARGEEARAGIDHLLTFQKEDGSFEILNAYWKENGIVLYILYRHALLTGDLEWLEERWPVVERIVAAIENLRERSREDPEAVFAGLLPPGFPDGGVGGVHAEYTNVYWCLAGLRAAAEAASLLGREEQAAEWRGEFLDFLSVFRERSETTRIDRGDGTYALPVLMEPDPAIDPVRGQWAFCHAVHPGQVFPPEDPLVRGNLRLMDEAECEGLVFGTGWLAAGIWNYFASFYAHAHLWAGHGEKAADILYAFANHASPMGAWREEQMPQGQGEHIVGDMPHNWASAEFIRLVRSLIVLERGDELHLLEGLPRAWIVPGAELRLDGVATDFGAVDLELKVDATGATATLTVTPEWGNAPSRIVIYAGAWAKDAQLDKSSLSGVYAASFSISAPGPRPRGLNGASR